MDSNKMDLVVSSTSSIDFNPAHQAPVASGKINGQTETDTTGADKQGTHILNIFEILSQLTEILYRLYCAHGNRAVTQSQIEIAKLNNQYESLSKKEDSIDCGRRAGMINAIVGTVVGSVSAAVSLGSCRFGGGVGIEVTNMASKGAESGFNVWSTNVSTEGQLADKQAHAYTMASENASRTGENQKSDAASGRAKAEEAIKQTSQIASELLHALRW